MDLMTKTFEEATQQIAALGSLLILIGVVVSIILYVLFAIGLGSVARTCRIRHSWMAWLPIARKHLLTEIADLRRVQAGNGESGEHCASGHSGDSAGAAVIQSGICLLLLL